MLNDKWDIRFLELAKTVANWSLDPSTKTGAVLVSPDRTDITLAYNGFPRKMSDNVELYANREEKYGRIIHAEMNAIMLRNGKSAKDFTLYTWPFLSCHRCAVHMIQAGVIRVVAPKLTDDKVDRWGKSIEVSKTYFAECGISVVEIEGKI